MAVFHMGSRSISNHGGICPELHSPLGGLRWQRGRPWPSRDTPWTGGVKGILDFLRDVHHSHRISRRIPGPDIPATDGLLGAEPDTRENLDRAVVVGLCLAEGVGCGHSKGERGRERGGGGGGCGSGGCGGGGGGGEGGGAGGIRRGGLGDEGEERGAAWAGGAGEGEGDGLGRGGRGGRGAGEREGEPLRVWPTGMQRGGEDIAWERVAGLITGKYTQRRL